MSNKNLLLSFFLTLGISQFSIPTNGQVLLPYTPQLSMEQLEAQGLKMAEEASQLVRFQQHDHALSRAKLAVQLAPQKYQPWFILGACNQYFYQSLNYTKNLVISVNVYLSFIVFFLITINSNLLI